MTRHAPPAQRLLRLLRTTSLGSLACLAAWPLHAQDAGNPYLGLSYGRTQGYFGDGAQVGAGLPLGGSVNRFSHDRRDTGYKLYGGWQFNRFIALEAGYFDLGKLGYDATTAPAGTVSAQFKVQGINLDAVGLIPLTTHLSALGRVGVQAARTRATFDNTGAVDIANQSQRNTNGKYGVGLQYAVGSVMMVRAEIERHRVNDSMGGHANVNLVSLGLVFPFGNTSPAPRAQAPRTQMAPMQAAAPQPMPMPMPAPAPVVAMPAPMPAPLVMGQATPPMVVAPARRRVTFSAESLFGFDRSTVNAEGMAALDNFARELDGTQFEMVIVEGHTDRLGTAEYNQTLSQQRADAVKSYLVTSGHVDPMKITATGRSESAPVTKPEDCVGTRATAELIICLKADRRVDVDVAGTR